MVADDTLIDLVAEDGWTESQKNSVLAEIESPPWWYDDSQHWTWFVADLAKDDWPTLPLRTKIMLYLTARSGANRLPSGALDD
jgi:hypothetical protein